jgi:non-ribosomal peptide synthetase component F
MASNPAFDASTMEVWGALLHGGQVVVFEMSELLDVQRFGEALQERGVTVLWLTTALFNQCTQRIPRALASLRVLLSGGERNDPQSFARVLEHGGPEHLVHGYGPTETTTFAVTYEV